MAELKGSLSGVGLPAVVQLIGELHNTGTLHLSRGQATSRLVFDDGHLVDAECGAEQGLHAVARSATDFADADFRFVDGPPPAQRAFDLNAADVTQLAAGAQVPHSAADEHVTPVASVCPMLGFADDRDHHYSRSTAMHRCYASGAPSVITAQEQHELCLTDRFPTCPRFRTAEATAATPDFTPPARPVPPPSGQIPPRVAARLVAASQMHLSSPEEPADAPPRQPAPAATLSQGAANDTRREPLPIDARLAGARQMHISTPAQRADPPPRKPAPAARPSPEPANDRRRGALFIAAGATAGLALLLLLGLFALPALRGGVAQTSATPSIAPSAVSPPSAVRSSASPAAVASPRAPAASPVAAAAQRLPAPTPPPTDPNSLIDARFASGAADRWVDNQPYAGWADGAYRFFARDATHFVAVGIPADRVFDDVVVSATFRKTGGPPGGGYGLIVRDQGPEPRNGVNQELNAYVLETGDLGEFGVWRREGDHWVDLVPWTRSSAVRAGGSPNDLVVRAIGDQLTFSVNDSVVATVTDDTYAQGGVGLFVGGDYNEVALDRFNVKLPD